MRSPGEGTKVRLTPTESRLLHLLITHTGQVLTTDMIIERVWGYDEAGDSGLVKTHIRHLRQKVEPEANNPQYIMTVPGVGYTFTAPITIKILNSQRESIEITDCMRYLNQFVYLYFFLTDSPNS